MTPAVAQARVLVVDDSVVMRRVVARALERDPAIARTRFAGSGQLALAKIAESRPDVVVLDVETPGLDGFGTLADIRRRDPNLPVVLFSSVDEPVAAATMEALSLGVTAFVVKPTLRDPEAAAAYVEEHLTPLIKALAAPRDARPRPLRADAARERHAVEAVVVGVSTGGPDALVTLVSALPEDLCVPVFVVQHMPPMFTRLLAERLDRLGGLRVTEARKGEAVRPGSVYIAPGNRHLRVTHERGAVRVALTDGPPENSCRPAADVLFRSAVEVYGAGVLAVILTGMGQDGLRGCQAVRAACGQVVVQDPATAVIGSMPAAVVDAGLAQGVLPLHLLAPELVQRIRGGPAR